MVRFVVLIAFAAILVGICTYPTGGPDGVSAGGADAAAAGSFDKLIGTATGHYHLSFADYIQSYDGITTASIEWKEDPAHFDPGCHCRAFFATQPVDSTGNPTGGIDWSWSYATESECCTCSDHVEGHVAAGPVRPDRSDQMLILWEDPNDPTQYAYSASGAVVGNAVLNCEGGLTFPITSFLNIPGPDLINTTTPSPLAQAEPAQAGSQASPDSLPSCDSSIFRVPRNAPHIHGTCYQGNVEVPFDPYDYTTYTWDFKLPPEPIVFIHGFLGSEIKCGGAVLWPNISLVPPSGPNLLQMALDIDGTSPAPGACGAAVGDIVDAVPRKEIYKGAIDFLNQLEPGNVFFFNWDWRKSPEQSLAALDAFIDDKRASHDNSKVVIMAHSYGGLLARLYVSDSGRADKVARVLTVGTPAWGAPKALFPLYAGIEEPDAPFLSLGLFLNEGDLKEFSKNLTGEYFLYPSQSYGDWLTVDPFSSTPVDRQGLQSYVLSLGGNPALLGQALNLHASTLDAPYIPGPDDPAFEVIVGTGKPTITAVQVLPGGYLGITYDNGDGTVPARSAARGALGATNPNKARTHYSCYVDHVDLPGKAQITDAVKDFLQFGDEIVGLTSPCSGSGFQLREFHLPSLASDTSVTQDVDGALSIEDAVLQGLADRLYLPKEKFVITGSEFPEIALPRAKFLEVTPLSDNTKGAPTIYGPLDGQITISSGVDGPMVLVDGQPAPLHGDVNCDRTVTVLDALLLILHAAGTPMSQPADCTTIGSGAEPFGDLDCDASVAANDALADLQIIAGVSLTFLVGCQ